MRILVLYRPDSEFSRISEDFIRDYSSRYHNVVPESLNIDSREGASMASIYDIVQYPAILVLQHDGSVQKVWQGPKLPLIDEVASYANN